MKKITSLLLLSVFIMSLAACTVPQKEATKVKCPSCGFEYELNDVFRE